MLVRERPTRAIVSLVHVSAYSTKPANQIG
jgi:hypothetical protein